MSGAMHRVMVPRVGPRGVPEQWLLWYRERSPSGDGITVPLDLGGVDLEAVTGLDRSEAPPAVWDWAAGAFDRLRPSLTALARAGVTDDEAPFVVAELDLLEGVLDRVERRFRAIETKMAAIAPRAVVAVAKWNAAMARLRRVLDTMQDRDKDRVCQCCGKRVQP